MRALILAAGYGSRLGELTKNRPKPMVEVGGKPIVEHILTRLYMAGVTEIILNLHYLPGVLTDYLGSRVLYFYEPRLLGHKGTILALKNWLKDDDFFVINGDTLSNVNYEAMQEFHKPGTITNYMDEWRSAGTWIYSKEYFNNQDLPVRPYREEGMAWFDVGTPERLEAARKFFEEQK